ncbi:MAG: restriction endonuclease subunit S [Thalassolituus maritimus]|nr:MAG: restriction endonuclease subunit S [Thalassolituus maritimus]
MVAIKDVANVVTGKTPSKSEDDNFGGEIPFVTPAELNGIAYVSSSPQTITEKGASKLKLVPRNSVMVCCIGSLGKLAIAGREVATNQQINSVIFDEKRVDPKYGYYALSTLKPVMEKLAPSTTVAIINKSNFEALEIPLPPLAEQQRIAAILDKADAIRRKRQQAIQLADDFLRAVFLDMFGDPVSNPKGWEVRPLGQISTFENGDRSSAYPSGDDLVSEGVLFLSTKNIVSDTLSLESCQYITEDKYMALSRGKAKRGDLIITLRGTLGSCCVFDCWHEKAFINAQMMIIRPDLGVGNIFLHDLLVSKAIKNRLQSIGQGAAVPQLTAKQLKELLLPIPSIQEQKRYEKIRDSVLTSIKKMQSESGVGLFEAISQKAFRGEL